MKFFSQLFRRGDPDNVPDPLHSQVVGFQNEVEGLVPGHVDELEGDFSFHVVPGHDVELGHVGNDPKGIDDISFPELQVDLFPGEPRPFLLGDHRRGLGRRGGHRRRGQGRERGRRHGRGGRDLLEHGDLFQRRHRLLNRGLRRWDYSLDRGLVGRRLGDHHGLGGGDNLLSDPDDQPVFGAGDIVREHPHLGRVQRQPDLVGVLSDPNHAQLGRRHRNFRGRIEVPYIDDIQHQPGRIVQLERAVIPDLAVPDDLYLGHARAGVDQKV